MFKNKSRINPQKKPILLDVGAGRNYLANRCWTHVDFYLNPTYVSEEDHKSIYSRCNPKYGDVIYIKDGATTGIAAVNPYGFEFGMLSSLAIIKVN